MEFQTGSVVNGALLLENFQSLCIKVDEIKQEPEGCEPLKRPLDMYIRNGFINLDKPLNPTAHQVCRYARDILQVMKTRHAGSFGPRVSGCLIVCINNAARLTKWLQNADNTFVVLMLLQAPLANSDRLKEICHSMLGPIFQREIVPRSESQGELRVRDLKRIELMEYDVSSGLGLLRIDYQVGIRIKTLCSHIGLLAGRFGILMEVRRIKSGIMSENDNLVTLHDVCDAKWLYDRDNDEHHLRSIIMPLERLLIGLKRIMVMDSAVAALCYGAKLSAAGILRFSNGISVHDEVVLMTTKGEAIALGTAMNTSFTMKICSHGLAVKLKRVIMDRDAYRKQWLETRERKKLRQNSASLRGPPQFDAKWQLLIQRSSEHRPSEPGQ